MKGFVVLSKEIGLHPGGDGDLLKDFMGCENLERSHVHACVHTHRHTHTLAHSLTS